MRAEHLKPLLEDEGSMNALGFAATMYAQAGVPEEVAQALALARLTALKKEGGGVRGIATGDVFWRLVSRALAQQAAEKFNAATQPYQYALQTRAGTDCLAALLRTASELNEDSIVISLDGVGAYDHVSRAAFMTKLREVAPELLPFVRLFYCQASTYYWWDGEGTRHEVQQGEGCEQGDALAPALFALGQHAALERAAAELQPGEFLGAFLDDLYVVTRPERARAAFDSTTRAVQELAGVQTNLGKCRVYSKRGGRPPPGIAELGEGVWRGDLSAEQQGLKILGSPVGSGEFVRAHAAARTAEEKLLLDEIPQLPDLQCAWLLLSMCAEPRANHLIRSLPPTHATAYARAHDEAVWQALAEMLGEEATPEHEAATARARELAGLPGNRGGLGLRNAERMSPAAYWGAWADALGVMQQKCPEVTERILQELERGDDARAQSLREAAAAAAYLDASGWTSRPSWQELADGARPPRPAADEQGEWTHGWQYQASLILNNSYREGLMSRLSNANRAMVRSQSGPQAAAWLRALPTDEGTTMSPQCFQIAIRRRLRLPLPPRSRQ